MAFCSALNKALRAVCLAWLVAAPVLAHDTGAHRATLLAGDARLDVEIAATPAERELGLMHRTALPENHGMWFVFETPGRHCLWMKDTLVPLSAAFIAEDGAILNLADMSPLSLTPHCAVGEAAYVLEVNQGWFARHSLAPGSRLDPPH